MRVSGIILFIFSSSYCSAQNYGSFSFLEIPGSAFLNGIGGKNVSRVDRDNNLVTSNPALVSSKLKGHLSLNYVAYPGNVKISNVTYTTDIGKTGNWSANVIYFNYGEIDAYDDTGASIGKFKSSEYAITISKSHKIGNIQVGGNIKLAASEIAGYNATGLMVDLGGAFIHPTKDFTAGMTIRNLGGVINDYTQSFSAKLPFDVQVGTSFKPEHMPFRFSLSIYDLTQWSTPVNLPPGFEERSTADQVFSHTIWGLELLVGKYVQVLLGYDHKRRKELKNTSASSGSGFSYGFLVGVNAFEFGYSRATYHVAGASNTFTVRTEISKLVRGKRTLEN